MAVDCTLWVDGAPFADTVPDLITGAPTALADLTVVWGRDTTVDQPAAATCTTVIVDRTAGSELLAVLDVGAPVEVFASGNVATGAADNVAVDPGFETLTPGPAGARVAVTTGVATVVTAPVHAGVRAIAYDPVPGGSMLIPPAAFTAGDPTGWDDIQTYDPSTVWNWSLAVHVDHLQPVTITPVLLTGPTFTTPGPAIGPPVTVTGPLGWITATGATTPAGGAAGGWVGLLVNVPTGTPWSVVPGTWAAAPGTWLDYRGVVVDDVAMIAPADNVRTVLVFSGVVTDMSVVADAAGTLTATVVAADQLVDLENRAVADVPWPSETFAARVGHILTASGADVDTIIDPGLAGYLVTWLDVDNQAAGSLLAEYTAGVDGVLWSATHATTGPFLWFEDMRGRAQLGHLEMVGAMVVIIEDGEERRGTTHLDGCLLPVDPVVWVRDVSDVITRVDATWSEQTLDDTGNPKPTDRVVTVMADPDTVTRHGVRRMAVTTHLTTESDATSIADHVLFRASDVEWRTTGLTLDAGITPPAAGAATADMLNLLDGTARLGRGLIVSDVPLWPGDDTVGLYLEGGTYRFDGSWELAMNTSSNTGLGTSARWDEMDPTWAWNEMDPTIAWFDMYGIAA